MTHVTACQDNDPSECLSLQKMAHVTAYHDNDIRARRDDSRNCMP